MCVGNIKYIYCKNEKYESANDNAAYVKMRWQNYPIKQIYQREIVQQYYKSLINKIEREL